MAWIEVWAAGRNTARCRSCNARIEWATTVKNGKKMPFDAPIVAVSTKRHPETGEAIDVVDSTVTTSHFATCPDAEKHRRKP